MGGKGKYSSTLLGVNTALLVRTSPDIYMLSPILPPSILKSGVLSICCIGIAPMDIEHTKKMGQKDRETVEGSIQGVSAQEYM